MRGPASFPPHSLCQNNPSLGLHHQQSRIIPGSVYNIYICILYMYIYNMYFVYIYIYTYKYLHINIISLLFFGPSWTVRGRDTASTQERMKPSAKSLSALSESMGSYRFSLRPIFNGDDSGQTTQEISRDYDASKIWVSAGDPNVKSIQIHLEKK